MAPISLSGPADITEYVDLKGKKEIIKSGGHFDIIKAVDVRDNHAVAVKRVRLAGAPDQVIRRNVEREIQTLSVQRHENVLPIIGIMRYDGDNCIPMIVTPWMDRGNLYDLLREDRTMLSKEQKLGFVIDISRGLEHLHSKEIVHADLKSPNIFISGDGRAVIGDFSLSRHVSCVSITNECGSTRWTAYELLDCDEEEPVRTFASDIWAFGMVIYEIVTAKLPFTSLLRDVTVMQHIQQMKLPKIESEEEFVGFPELVQICHLCWAKQPALRPSAATIRLQLNDHRDVPTVRLTAMTEITFHDAVPDSVLRFVDTFKALNFLLVEEDCGYGTLDPTVRTWLLSEFRDTVQSLASVAFPLLDICCTHFCEKACGTCVHEYLFKDIPSTSECIKTTILDLEKLLVESETLYSPLVKMDIAVDKLDKILAHVTGSHSRLLIGPDNALFSIFARYNAIANIYVNWSKTFRKTSLARVELD